MGQILGARILVRPSEIFGPAESVHSTTSQAATWCKLFMRIAGTFAGVGTVLCFTAF